MEQSGGVFAEQVIRPTGLIDPPVEVRSAKTQVDDVLGEIRETAAAGYRTLVTVLTKRMAEDLTEYLHEQGIRVRYMHSDIDTLERIEIIRDLRLGAFDVLVGINLLREGLDIPECGFVAILDADKEGFLRSETSLVQTIGRAARNVDGKVILYADQITGSMSAPWRRPPAAAKSRWPITRPTASPRNRSRRRSPTSSTSVYEKDHVRADIGIKGVKGGLTDTGRQQPRRPSQSARKTDARRRRRPRLRKRRPPARRNQTPQGRRTRRHGRPDGTAGGQGRRPDRDTKQ